MAESTVPVVALLRGINVGGKNRLAMADLRAIASALEYERPATYLQSGNLVLPTVSATRVGDVAAELRTAIRTTLDLDTAIMCRTGDEWARIVAANPFVDEALDGTKVHVVFRDQAIGDEATSFDASPFAPERLASGEREIYLSLPNGIGRSKLATALTRTARSTDATVRNWNTVAALAALLDVGDSSRSCP